MQNYIILIGGAPCSGKSTLAVKLSKRLNIPWVSTDQIRSIMQGSITDKENHPDLFNSYDISAEGYYNARTVTQIVEDENKQSAEVHQGIKALINDNYNWDSYIIEGIAITPEFVSCLISSTPQSYQIKPLFLIEENQQRIRESVFSRGLWDDADKYPDKFKEVEVDWVVAYNDWLKSELEKYHYPRLIVGNREDIEESSMKALGFDI